MTASTVDTPRATAVPNHQVNYSFAPSGRYASCFAGYDSGPRVLERWSFDGDRPTRLAAPQDNDELPQNLCTDDGRVLVVRTADGSHRLDVAEFTGAGVTWREVRTVGGLGLRVVHTPDPALLALAISPTARGTSTLMAVARDGSAARQLVELPGIAGQCSWLDATGRRLAVNVLRDGVSTPTEVDLCAGTTTPLSGTRAGQHFLLHSPASGMLLLAAPVDGRLRLAYGSSAGGDLVYSRALDASTGTAAPLAIDPSGHHVAIRVQHGARSHLVIHTPDGDAVRTLDLPPGVVGGVANWSEHGLRFPFSTPTRPPGIATIRRPLAGSALSHTSGSAAATWVDADVCDLPGAQGPIEAVVHGADWRDAPRLLVWLHGGPESATRLEFDPLAQRLAAAGIAVVAPNYRGSTGYGQAHQSALVGAWGVPDLEDIRAIGRSLTRQRRAAGKIMVAGTSYGAFLAVLAAAADPDLWSHCVAVAPFLSGAELYEDGSPAVRALLDRLGGRATATDAELGPRHLTEVCARIEARMLIIHGRVDPVIPVRHSRELRDALRRAAATRCAYIEPARAGHDPFQGSAGTRLVGEMVRFLGGSDEVRGGLGLAGQLASAASVPIEKTDLPHADCR